MAQDALALQGVDLTAEEMAAHSESIDDDLANSPTARSSLNSILQERLDTSPTAQDKKRASGRSRLANASFPGATSLPCLLARCALFRPSHCMPELQSHRLA